jgi:ATP-dependent Clp protease adaptor protein ClpS
MSVATPDIDESVDTGTEHQLPSVLVVFDDPVNLISFVATTFQKVFNWDRETAMHHTLEVHEHGRSAVYSGERPEVERYAAMLRSAGLWVMVSKD